MRKRKFLSLLLAMLMLVTPIFPAYAAETGSQLESASIISQAAPLQQDPPATPLQQDPPAAPPAGPTSPADGPPPPPPQAGDPPAPSAPGDLPTLAPSTPAEAPVPVVTGGVTPYFVGWAYNYAKAEYIAYFNYTSDYTVDGKPTALDYPVVTPTTADAKNQIVQENQKRFEPLLPVNFEPTGDVPTVPFALGKGPSTDPTKPEAYQHWLAAAAITWKVDGKEAIAKVSKDLVNTKNEPLNQTKQATVQLSSPTVSIVDGKKVITMEQGDTVTIASAIDGRDNPNPTVGYQLSNPLQVPSPGSTITEAATVLQRLSADPQAPPFTFKAYEVGQATFSAKITNNMPPKKPNGSMTDPQWEALWPPQEDTIIINVVPKSEIGFETGKFFNMPTNGAVNQLITLSKSYPKLVALTQVMNPLEHPIISTRSTLMPAAAEQSLIVGSSRNDLSQPPALPPAEAMLLDQIREHEFLLQENSFKTLYETNKGMGALRPFTYFASDAGLLKDQSGKVIGITDTAIIDHETRRIFFHHNFEAAPVVVAQLASMAGQEYGHARVIAVTNTYFDVIIEAWDSQETNNQLDHEYLSYMAVEVGIHQLKSGEVLESGVTHASSVVFETIFDQTPVLFSQTQSLNDKEQVVIEHGPFGIAAPQASRISTDALKDKLALAETFSTAAKKPVATMEDDALGFTYALLSESGSHDSETVGYVAIGNQYTPVATRVELRPASATAFDVPYADKGAVTQQYTGMVFDQHGREMPTLVVPIVATKPALEAATKYTVVDGLLSVTQATTGGKLILTAKYQDLASAPLTVTINREAPRETKITLTGPSDLVADGKATLAVPYVGKPKVTAKFVAKVIDQYGFVFENPGVDLTLTAAKKAVRSTFALADPIKLQRAGTLALTNKTLGGDFKIIASYKTLEDAVIEGVITREDPKVYKVQLKVNVPAPIATGSIKAADVATPATDAATPGIDDTINVPYYQLADVVHAYIATATDQYGEAIAIDPSLEGADLPPDVALAGMSLSVSYDDDAGIMSIWTVLKSVDAWHKTILEQKSNTLSVAIVKEAPRPTWVEFNKLQPGEDLNVNQSTLDVPYVGNTLTQQYKARVFDQYGYLYKGQAIFSVKAGTALPEGVVFTGDTLTLTPSSHKGSFVLQAGLQDARVAELQIVINKEEPIAKRIEIQGASSVVVPQNEQPAIEKYTTKVYDQYGALLETPVFLMMEQPVVGTTFKAETAADLKTATSALTVTHQAPHGYVELLAYLGDLKSVKSKIEIAPSVKLDAPLVQTKVVFLKKSVQVTKDDINNLILGVNDNMQYTYRSLTLTADSKETVWLYFNGENLPTFPGNIDVQVRYGTNWYSNKLKPIPVMEPGLATTLKFTVLAPVIDGPSNFVGSTTPVIRTMEDPTGRSLNAQTKSYYSLDNGLTWILSTVPFSLTATGTVQAKTVTTVTMAPPIQMGEVSPGTDLRTIAYESAIVSRTFTKVNPPRETEETQPATQPITINNPVIPQGPLTTLPELQTPLGALDFESYALGYSDGSFKPKQAVTRSEFAAMLARLMKLDVKDTTTGFKDVPSTLWYAGHVKALKKVGIIKGDTKGKFRPDDILTKAELAVMMANYWSVAKKELPTTGAPYTDIKGHWASASINKLYNSGIMEGFTDSAFRPNSGTSREQIIVMLNRATDRPIYKEAKSTYSDVASDYWSFGNIESAARTMSN